MAVAFLLKNFLYSGYLSSSDVNVGWLDSQKYSAQYYQNLLQNLLLTKHQVINCRHLVFSIELNNQLFGTFAPECWNRQCRWLWTNLFYLLSLQWVLVYFTNQLFPAFVAAWSCRNNLKSCSLMSFFCTKFDVYISEPRELLAWERRFTLGWILIRLYPHLLMESCSVVV